MDLSKIGQFIGQGLQRVQQSLSNPSQFFLPAQIPKLTQGIAQNFEPTVNNAINQNLQPLAAAQTNLAEPFLRSFTYGGAEELPFIGQNFQPETQLSKTFGKNPYATGAAIAGAGANALITQALGGVLSKVLSPVTSPLIGATVPQTAPELLAASQMGAPALQQIGLKAFNPLVSRVAGGIAAGPAAGLAFSAISPKKTLQENVENIARNVATFTTAAGAIPIIGAGIKNVVSKFGGQALVRPPLPQAVEEQLQALTQVPEKGQGITPTNINAEAVNVEDLRKTVLEALKSTGKKAVEQKQMISEQSSKRLGKSLGILEKNPTIEGFYKAKAALAGPMQKPQFDALEAKLGPEGRDKLIEIVMRSPTTSGFNKINAVDYAEKLLRGENMSPRETGILRNALGDEFVDTALKQRTFLQKAGSFVLEATNVPRALKATMDFSASLRQNILVPFSHPLIFVNDFAKQFGYFASEKSYQASQSEIASRPSYQLILKGEKLGAGNILTDIGGPIVQKEEMFRSNMAEKIPIVRNSTRAFVGLTNRLRADIFDSLYQAAKNSGRDMAKDDKLLVDTLKHIGNMTGRGSLGTNFERSAVLLSQGLFAPRLMAARINVLNPIFYKNLDPFVRKEALKTIISFGVGITTILGLAKMGGADVGTDWRSADFGKIRVGNTRYDLTGGFQQYVRALGQLWSGETVNTTTGKIAKLGSGFGQPTRADVVTRFFQAKEAPLIAYATSLLKGQTIMGEKFRPGPEAVDLAIPFVLDDLTDLMRENNFIKSAIMDLPGLFGVGVQTYGTEIPVKGQTPSGRPNVQWRGTPSLGEETWNKITGTPVTTFTPAQQRSMWQAEYAKRLREATISNRKLQKQSAQFSQPLITQPQQATQELPIFGVAK